MSLAGKTLFISGGSRGIGLAIALRAARDGANIVIAAKTADPDPRLEGTIHTAAAAIEAAGGKALPLVVDIRDEERVKAAVAEAVRVFGGIDILVNNASAIRLTGTLDTPVKRYDLMHGVNGTRHVRVRPGLPAPSPRRGEPAHPDAIAAARHRREVVPAISPPTPLRNTR